ncbi:MAG: orotidine-5'-phosphate decarboxylase [Defluviitaleaceae bacterium]|nr:orotidine-5'-phosphate decarboxylase [Defluviitaleaceae bacterium]
MIDRLIDKINQMNNPTVVGLDPQMEFVPKGMSVLEFNTKVIDAIYDIVPAIKLQIAFYEALGLVGLEVYKQTIAYAKEKGMVVIADIKRGDIASTAQAYANAHIGERGDFCADFATINPYMGSDTVKSWLDNCKIYGKGVFVLVKTSNAGSGDFQDLIVGDKPLYEVVAQRTAEWGADMVGNHGYSTVAAVVGATHPQQLADLRAKLPHTFFLVPGYGVQGGTSADIRYAFDKKGGGAIINSSRGIITAHQNPEYEGLGFEEAIRDATLTMRNDLRSVLS